MQDHNRRTYFEALDLVLNCIKKAREKDLLQTWVPTNESMKAAQNSGYNDELSFVLEK